MKLLRNGALAALTLAAAAAAAQAHEFTAAVFVVGPGSEIRLAEAVNGFLLAADERDGHTNETSDGHLGGVDVQVLPLPREAAAGVRNLLGSPANPPDVVIVFGADAAGGDLAQGIAGGAITFVQSEIPDETAWIEDAWGDGFAARYRDLYGQAPTSAAAQGYAAARRLDAAIRPHDGLEPRQSVEAALAESADRMDW